MSETQTLPAEINEFNEQCSLASYHFADDSGKEWGNGYTHQRNAQRIYDDASPDLKALIREFGKLGLATLKTGG